MRTNYTNYDVLLGLDKKGNSELAVLIRLNCNEFRNGTSSN